MTLRHSRRGALRLALALAAPAGLAPLYTALAPPANAAEGLAEGLRAAASGEMATLIVHDAPKPRIQAAFVDADGAERRFADLAGRIGVVNFWATWCPPCLKEMPAIDRLAAALAAESAEAEVLAISTDFGGADRPRAWLERNGIDHLAFLHDRDRGVAKAAGLEGLPVTLLLDREGREVARYIGEAAWDGPEARAVIDRLIALTAPGSAG